MVKKIFALDDHLAKELELVAKVLHTSQKEVVEKALDFYFDYIDSVVADKIIDEIEAKNVKTYSKEEAYKKLGI